MEISDRGHDTHSFDKGQRPFRFSHLVSEGMFYGFTDEALDFIINYDIKYCMGRDGGGGEEEEE